MNTATQDYTESKSIKKVICGKCAYFIAVIERGWLFIKMKGLAVHIKGGAAKIRCVQCGTVNIFMDEEYKKLLGSSNELSRKTEGAIEPEIRPWFVKQKKENEKGELNHDNQK